VVGRSDSEAIRAQRPHLDRRALDVNEGSRWGARPGLGLVLRYRTTDAISPAMQEVRCGGRASGGIRRVRRGAT
jgi:hypothetical protein